MTINCLSKRRYTLLIHIAFFVIVVGGVVTWLTSTQGSVEVGKDAFTHSIARNSGTVTRLPFGVRLSHFEVANYPGSDSPMDYICTLSITDNDAVRTRTLSMNNVLSHRHYRFYIHSYDPATDTVRLSVFHDPYGIAITYTGYALLLYALILFFFDRRSTFRALLRQFSKTINTPKS